jgi:GT2 family glycosyltransferase/2-polyprenyl-3-methyl-5-hydroxy-6-metoxy-1,4-benzoquinol methylase
LTSTPEPSDLTVIIPTRNRSGILRRTLDALEAQTAQGFETVVVVDGTDSRPPELRGPRVVVKEQGGPGSARNAGVAASNRRLVLFLGDDMVPAPDLVAEHLEGHTRHPDREDAVLGTVDWHSEAGEARILRWMDWSGSQFDYHTIVGEDAGWGRFYSCNVSLKRDFFLAAGGFDEDFTYYYEDLDLGWRLGQLGLRLWYRRQGRVEHLHSYRLENVIGRFEGVAKGERLMAVKHDWFSPWYANRMQEAAGARPVSPIWPYIADVVPENLPQVRRKVRRRANRWYHQQLAPAFFNSWEGDRDLAELQTYLGPGYDHDRLVRHREEVEREEEALGDEDHFYRTSEAYLYDLTAFAMSGTKAPYLADLRRLLPPGASVLDYGCGIGSDGLRLLDVGYRVAFCDFDNPSTRYLRWRLKHRELEAPVYDLDRDEVPSGFDSAFSFDVIEHVEDPEGFLAQLEARASLVAVNLLEPDPADPHIHRPLPIRQLIDRATRRGLLRYRRYHGRSHLVIYRGSPTTDGIGRLRSRAEAWAGRHRS